MMKIVFDPSQSNTNAYVNIICQSLSKHGIQAYSLRDIFRDRKLFKEIDIVHLNWFENVNSYSEFLKKLFKLVFLIVSGKYLLWTFHNKKPHNSSFSFLSQLLMWLLARYSKMIIIHSHISSTILAEYYGEEIQKKIKYIPHPDYIGVYGDRVLSRASTSKKLSLLFLGAVKPYKNIELLIEAIQAVDSEEDVELTVMGKPANNQYKNSLIEKAEQNKNIHLQLQFIDDSQISEVLSNYDLLVLPYNMDSSLNSGSVLLAFSYGKTVLCPSIGTIQDFIDDPHIMSYTYTTQADHLLQLTSTINKCIEIKKQNPQAFIEMGETMLKKIEQTHSINLVATTLSNIYHLKI